MEWANLSSASADQSSGTTLSQWAVGAVLFIVLPALLLAIMVRRHRDPTIKGPALRGSAHVLWVKPTSEQSFGPQSSGWVVCRIGLRVDVPRLAPYDAETIHHVSPMEWPRIQGGATIPVLVDSADPTKVRVDFTGPD